jgi:cytochrome c-type biogenesis protein CcmH/NrfG
MNTINQSTAIKTPDTQAVIEYRMGFQAYSQGNKDDALEHFQMATFANPNYVEAQRWLGRVALELGLGAEAQKAFEIVLRFQGQNPSIMVMLEFARNVKNYGLESAEFFRAGCSHQDQAQQIQFFKNAVKANPKHQQAWAWLSRLTFENRDYDGAVEASRQALKLDPDDAGSAHRLRLALRHVKPALVSAQTDLPVTVSSAR